MRFWMWLDSNSVDGRVDSVVSTDVDAVVDCAGFAQALISVGWLSCDDALEVITTPNFGNHNGETAKKRALKNKRQSKWRNKDVIVDGPVDASVSTSTSTREEKKREKKNNNKSAVIDDDGTPNSAREFNAVAVDDWHPDDKIFDDLRMLHGVPGYFVDQPVGRIQVVLARAW